MKGSDWINVDDMAHKDLGEFSHIQWEMNSFMPAPYPISDFPQWKDSVAEELDWMGFRFITKEDVAGKHSIQPFVPVDTADPMCFNVSVGEHTDDVPKNIFFGLYVVFLENVVEGFHDWPELEYCDAWGKRHTAALTEDTLIVFNPRRKHRLHYYGEMAKLLLFSVTKIKQK